MVVVKAKPAKTMVRAYCVIAVVMRSVVAISDVANHLVFNGEVQMFTVSIDA